MTTKVQATRMFAAMAMLLAAGAASADVFNMGGTQNPDGIWIGTASLVTVPVGNPGNAADTRYRTPGYGSVSYEYNIGKYEVTAAQYCEFLNAVAATDTYDLYNSSMWTSTTGCKIERRGSSGSYTYSVFRGYDNRPVNYVSFGDAMRFANWLHNGQPTGAQGLATKEDGAYYLNGATSSPALVAVSRESDWKWAVTSEDEWYKAAYYDPATGSYYDYPTRSNSVPGNHLEGPDPGNNACFDAALWFPIDVGAYENSDSPCGTFDQGGNVWEWNEAIWYVGDPYRGMRGGSFRNDHNSLLASRRELSYPTNESDALGFRVSEVPEPGTVALLALGGLALIRRRNPGTQYGF